MIFYHSADKNETMTIIEFNNAISDFDKGLINFNLGSKWSFFYNGKWYPTHALVKKIHEQGNYEGTPPTLHKATHELSKILPIISKQVVYSDHYPVFGL